MKTIAAAAGRFRRWCWLALAAPAMAGAAAQDRPAGYPSRPIRLIVPVAPGAGSDMIARAAAQMITDRWGQQIVVDNRSGGGGVIATELVAKAPADGYTILSQGETIILQGALKRVPFDILKVFEPVVAMSAQPYVMVTSLTLPIRSIKEMIAFSHTQTVTYSGSSGIGSTVHLGMEHFAQISGAKLQYVPYKGSAPAILGVMGGEIHIALGSSIAASSAVRTGKVRALAALGLTRMRTMPDVPTVAEQGYPGFKITNRYNLFVPAGTPKAIIDALNRVVTEGMNSPQMVQRLELDGSQPAERMTPAELRATIARELADLERQVKKLNLKLD